MTSASVACAILAAAAVLPADRLAMADRMFNRGDYENARAEYAAIVGTKALPADELLFRMAECERALGKSDDAKKSYDAILSRFPQSAHADRARLMKALLSKGEERTASLRLLDADTVDKQTRAAALYHLGVEADDMSALERCVREDPSGKYAPYAKFRRASKLAASKSPEDVRTAVSLLVDIAFGQKGDLAEQALYVAAATSCSAKKFGEAESLFRRYAKMYPEGKYAADSTRMCAWCCYLGGKYAAAAALCGDGSQDDLGYIAAASAHASGDTASAFSLYRAYLERHPQGKYRKEAELPLARLGFEEAEKAGDAVKMVECSKRAASMSGAPGDRLRLAWAYGKADRPLDAEREYLALAKDFPGTAVAAEAMFRKATADIREERWAQADLALREALSGQLDARFRPEAQYWRGVAAVKLGHGEEAMEALKGALEGGLTLDQSREARLIVADLDLAAGRTNEAKAVYTTLVREGAVERMGAARTFAVGRMLGGEEAKTCARALVKSPSPEWRQCGYALLGDVEAGAGSFQAAIAAYRGALAEKCTTSSAASAARRLGALETAAGEWERAEATLKRAVELNPGDVAARAESYFHLAEAAAATGRPDDARAYATVVTTLFENTEYSAPAAKLLKGLPGGDK